MMRQLLLFLLILCFRLFNALTLSTFFQPDEYYQSLEVAHDLVFGHGYVTWEYKHGIRSFCHALIYAIPYALLRITSLDSVTNVVLVPKIIGAFQSALCDYYTAAFIQKHWHAGKWSLISLCSAWTYFTMTRSLANSLETAITAYALYKWPFKEEYLSDEEGYILTTLKSLSAIGSACLVRPTNAMIWLAAGIQQIHRHKTTFLFEAIFIAYVALQYAAIIDSFYYGAISFPILSFLKFNTGGSASFYGTNQWHYYITQGIPQLCAGLLPFFIHGMFLPHPLRKMFLGTLIINLSLYSIIAHKEVRFLMPLLPIIHGLIAHSCSKISRSLLGRITIIMTIVMNIILGFYGGHIHQSGVMRLIDYVSTHREINDLMLYMPCHSTPWQSHIHRNATLRFLTCEPPITGLRDEADDFYNGQAKFLDSQPAYRYIAIFETSAQNMTDYWSSRDLQYELNQSWFNTHFHDDWRRRGNVLLYKLK